MTTRTIEIPDDISPANLALLEAVLASIGVPSSGGGDASWRNETGFPKVKLINGAHVLLHAPVNPEWQPSSMAQTFGGQAGSYVADPSSPPGARSPSGFPTVGGFIQFGDGSFQTEAQLTAWRGASASQGNQGGIDAQQQATLQPWQVDVKAIPREQLEGLLVAIARNEVGLSAKYGPTKLLHELSAFMPNGITDDGTGHVVPPPSFPELADLTVERAKQLAGLA